MNRDVFGDEQPLGAPVPSGGSGAGPADSAGVGFGPTATGPLAPAAPPARGFGPGGAGLGTDAAPVTAPTTFLALAGGCVLLSFAVAVAAEGRPALALVGWLVGGFAAVGLVACFTVADARRRADRWYISQSLPGVLRLVVLVGAVLAVAANSYFFADWVSRR